MNSLLETSYAYWIDVNLEGSCMFSTVFPVLSVRIFFWMKVFYGFVDLRRLTLVTGRGSFDFQRFVRVLWFSNGILWVPWIYIDLESVWVLEWKRVRFTCFTCGLIGDLDRNLRTLLGFVSVCGFLGLNPKINRWIFVLLLLFFSEPVRNPWYSFPLLLNLPLWSCLSLPWLTVNSHWNCREDDSMMKIQCWISENCYEFTAFGWNLILEF